MTQSKDALETLRQIQLYHLRLILDRAIDKPFILNLFDVSEQKEVKPIKFSLSEQIEGCCKLISYLESEIEKLNTDV